jgi:hypothetical protein
MTVVFLGLINWFATMLIVEAEITFPIRRGAELLVDRLMMSGHRRLGRIADKLSYLLHCHMCCGTWVGLIEAAVFGGPFHGFTGWVANGLLFKAIAHLVLELRPQSWYFAPHQAKYRVPKPGDTLPGRNG